MKASVVISRDILLQFFDKEKSFCEEEENIVIREILNINIGDKKLDEALIINSEIELKAQKAVRELFVKEYLRRDSQLNR